jgi:hypothetical protein
MKRQFVYIGQHERTDELNNRISYRNRPSEMMNSVYDPRPSETRRVVFPGLDCRHQSTIPIADSGHYNQHGMFNPGVNAPYSGYAHAVDAESSLQNIFMAKQKYCPQSQYIPSTSSPLYNKDQFSKNVTTPNPHYLLEKREIVTSQTPNTYDMGLERFHNHTRQQRMDMNLDEIKNKTYY